MSPRASALPPCHLERAERVERSPEEYEGRVSLGRASSAVGTGTQSLTWLQCGLLKPEPGVVTLTLTE